VQVNAATPESNEGAQPPVLVIGGRRGFVGWAREFWQYRGVLRALAGRDLRGKYKQAVLGIAWAVLQPLVLTGVFTFVFRGIVRLDVPVEYPVFVLSSLLVFQLFQQIIALGSRGFVTSRGIVTRVYFPRIYTVVVGGTSAYVNAAVTVVLLAIAMLWYRVGVGDFSGLAIALCCLASTVMMALGAAALLAAINARFRDIQHAIPFALTALMYVSPVLYPMSACPEWARTWVALNPVTGLVEGFRNGLLGIPGADIQLVAASCLGSVVVFATGVWLFERWEADLVDYL
jgi:lipopolysaccharide transport system permease protein